MQSNRDMHNKTGGWMKRERERRDEVSRQGGKLNVTSHI